LQKTFGKLFTDGISVLDDMLKNKALMLTFKQVSSLNVFIFLVKLFDLFYTRYNIDAMFLCFVLTAVAVDGKRVSAGATYNGVCGSVISLVLTVDNCTDSVLNDVSVQLLSVSLLPSESHAAFDSSVVTVGCLLSTFPHVSLLSDTLVITTTYSRDSTDPNLVNSQWKISTVSALNSFCPVTD